MSTVKSHAVGIPTRLAAAFGGVGLAVLCLAGVTVFLAAVRDVFSGAPFEWRELIMAPILVAGCAVLAVNFLRAAGRGVNPPWEDAGR